MRNLKIISAKNCYLFFLCLLLSARSYAQDSDTSNWTPAEKLWATIDFIKFKKDISYGLGISSSELDVYYNYLKKEFIQEKINFFNKADQGVINEENLPTYISNWNISIINSYDDFIKVKDDFILNSGNSTSQAVNGPCENIGFENGTFAGWSGSVGEHCIANGVSQVCNSINGLSQHCIMTPGMVDPLVPALPVVYPTSNYSLRLGNTVNGGHSASIRQVFKVDSSNLLLIYRYAVVLEDPQDHTDPERPYFSAKLYDQNMNEIQCANYTVIVQSNLNGFNRLCVNDPGGNRNGGGSGSPTTYVGTNRGCPSGAVGYDGSNTSLSSGNNQPTNGVCGNNQLDIYWKNWTTVSIPLNAYFGQNVTIEFVAADCEPSGHLGYAYLDGDCLPQKILSVGTSVCVSTGQRATLSGPSGFSQYQWTGPAGGIVGPSNTSTITVGLPGSYSVLLTPFNNSGAANSSCRVTLNFTVVENCSLPVDFISFTANINSWNSVNLQWITATETNNSVFEIQRSINGIDWDLVSTVNGTGTSTIYSSYNFLDSDLSQNHYYYRLKQIDQDGNSTFSTIASVDMNHRIDVVPSFIQRGENIEIVNPSGLQLSVSLFNLDGQLLRSMLSDERTFKFSGEDLNTGIFVVRLTTPHSIITKKIFVY